MAIDIFILSKATDGNLAKFTADCLTSLKKSEGSEDFNITVIEGNPKVNYSYPTKTEHYTEPFNYNGYFNRAIKNTSAEWIGCFNNDLIFDKKWYVELMKHKFDSMSPKSKHTLRQMPLEGIIKGYDISLHISGWALVFKRNVWGTIGGLDDTCNFWCSDNAYAEQLKEHKIDHYLICDSIVNHLEQGSKTLSTLPKDKRDELTFEQAKIFNKKYNKNLFNLNDGM